MATFNVSGGATTHAATGRVPYVVENVVDIGQVNSNAGIGAAGILQVISVLAIWFAVETAAVWPARAMNVAFEPVGIGTLFDL